MKKAILVTILGVFCLNSVIGQIQVQTISLTTTQDTSCVGTNINLQYQINNLNSSSIAINGCCQIEFNSMGSPTLIGSTSNFSITIPANSSTALSTITGTIPYITDGLYNIRVKFYTGCSTPSGGTLPTTPNKIYVLNSSAPTISANGPVDLCSNSTVVLTSSYVSGNSWNNGMTTQSITVSDSSASYYVTGTNQCGTVNSDTITINHLSLPTVAVSGDTSGCGSVVLSSSAINYTSLIWSDNVIGTYDTVTTSNVYYAVATNSCGSVNSDSISVTVHSLPTITATTSDSLICVGQTSYLTASGGSTYVWDNTQTTDVISVNPSVPTTYTVIGTDTNGCSNSATVIQEVTICTGIEETNNSKINNVYPIPAIDNINVELVNVNENSNISINIYSVDGKLVVSNNFKLELNKVSLDVSDLRTGIYLLEIVSESSKSIKRIAIAK